MKILVDSSRILVLSSIVLVTDKIMISQFSLTSCARQRVRLIKCRERVGKIVRAVVCFQNVFIQAGSCLTPETTLLPRAELLKHRMYLWFTRGQKL